MQKNLRIKYFPISFFAPILGLAGFTLSLQKCELLFNTPPLITFIFLIITLLLFSIILGLYTLKFIYFKSEVKKEYNHHIKINFFPLLSKILLVLSVFFVSFDLTTSKWFWIVGIILNTILSFHILGEWISKEHFKIEHMSPAWFIPVVGNLIIPISGIYHAHLEISWFFFSAGLSWMFILTTIILYRIIFHKTIVQKLLPTLFILFAAPSIAFIAYYKLTNNFDWFAHLLYYFALFLFILIVSEWKLFLKSSFYLSWWAYTFPLAAIFLATIQIHHITEFIVFKILAGFFIIVLSIFIILLSKLTIDSIKRKTICIED